MKRIIYISSTLNRSGPTNQLYNLVKYLDRSIFEPYLVTLSPEPQDSRWSDFDKLGVKLDSLMLSRIQGLFLAASRLKKKIQRMNPDLIHTQGIRADSLLPAIKPNIPWLLTSRNYPWHDYLLKFGGLKGRLMALSHMKVLGKCKYVIACSKTNAKLLASHHIKAEVIQNGVDPQRYQPVSPGVKRKLRHKFSLPQDTVVFISVGNLNPRKDMLTLFKGFSQIRCESQAVLLILGDGPQMHVLNKLANSNGSVHLIGKVNNVYDFLRASDVFVSTSLSEGLPNTVLEAMACGLPCVLSDIPSHRELFEEYEDKFFFPCGDIEALAHLLKSVKDGDLFSLGERSRYLVEKNFSAKKMSNEYQKIYLKAVI